MKFAELQTQEIIGTCVGHMRMDIADLYPEDEFLQRAKKLGISRNIRRVKRHPVVAGFDIEENTVVENEPEVELYSAQEAVKILVKVYGLERLPAPNQKALQDFNAQVERVMQAAIEAGVTLRGDALRKEVEQRLKPLYPLLKSNAIN